MIEARVGDVIYIMGINIHVAIPPLRLRTISSVASHLLLSALPLARLAVSLVLWRPSVQRRRTMRVHRRPLRIMPL